MKYEVYKEFRSSDDFSVIDFMSVGKKGNIRKRIEFTLTEIPGIVNLAFGDISEDGQINDYNKSDNGDRNKILATVAYAVDIYLNKYPERWVYFKGSTFERTRLYRIAIGLNYDELRSRFEIYIEQDNAVVPFKQNATANGFLIKKKMFKFDV